MFDPDGPAGDLRAVADGGSLIAEMMLARGRKLGITFAYSLVKLQSS